jgi:hypothetical protein
MTTRKRYNDRMAARLEAWSAQTRKRRRAMRTWITPPILVPAGVILLVAAYAAVRAFT